MNLSDLIDAYQSGKITMSQVARELGVSHGTIYGRMRRNGGDIAKAIAQPLDKARSSRHYGKIELDESEYFGGFLGCKLMRLPFNEWRV